MMTITDALIPGNFGQGRSRSIDMLVIHVMEGTMAGTLAHFRRRNPPDPVSAHYGISRAGEIVRYVRDEDTAWHAGRVLRPTAELVRERPGVNPNSYSLGIENEGTGAEPPAEAQVIANVALIRMLCARYAIPINRRHVVGHREIFVGKTCPGLIDVDELVERAHYPAPDVAEPALIAEHIPPNLERIIVPGPEHIDEAIRVRPDWTPDSVREGIALVEVILRGMQAAGVKHNSTKLVADALSTWLKATE